ncbi:DNA repair protein RecN [Bacillota bacterium LX-D]|nr:DNA repair protein RecN [Bacillota bacterium LX-D]
MLRELTIKNFALIDSLTIELSDGFNVLTGETGAGKSIIIDAIGILIGDRASCDFIREGCDKAIIEGYFDFSNEEELIDKLKETGLLDNEVNDILLSREITRIGKNVCRINGRMVSLNLYQELGRELIDIHGQNQEQSLFSTAKQLMLLDLFGGKKILDKKIIVKNLFDEMSILQVKLDNIKSNLLDKENKIDFLKYQIAEIAEANLQPKEDDDLVQEKNILANSEKLSKSTALIYRYLFSGDKEIQSAYDSLGLALNEMEVLVSLDPRFMSIKNGMESIMYQLEDYAREVEKYSENIEHDPYKLDAIEQRLDLIKQLKRKYGQNIEDILCYFANIQEQLSRLEDSENEVDQLNLQLEKIRQDYLKECLELSEIRKEKALELQVMLNDALVDLELPNSQFEIKVETLDKYQSNGIDTVHFLFSSNIGENLKNLEKVASGGEISRVMLAFKSVLAEVDVIPTLIFDEIDTGVGGSAILSLGNKLSKLALKKQVICVTHSPQLASFGDTHFHIYKQIIKDRTLTKIKKLQHQERIEEIARMLGGIDRLEGAREHAEKMLNFAFNEKCV